MSESARNRQPSTIRAEIERHIDLAVEAFGEELQARRPGTLDDDTAEAAKLRGELYASVAMRFAAATSEPEILAWVRDRIGPFVQAKLIDGWIRK